MITLPSINKREKTLICICLLVLFSFLYMKKIYRPAIQHLRDLKKQSWDLKNEITKLEFQFVDIKQERSLLDQAKNNYIKIEKELKSREDKLFSQAEIGKLLRKITQSAASHELDFMSITPKRKEDQALYVRFPIEIKLSSPYSGFLNYLKELETISDVLKVKKVDIGLEKSVSANPAVVIDLGTVLSDRPAVLTGQRVVSVASGAQLFTTQEETKVKTDTGLSNVKLSGIIWRGGEPTAIINDRVFVVGEAIGTKNVVEINEDSVILKEGDIKHTLKLTQ